MCEATKRGHSCATSGFSGKNDHTENPAGCSRITCDKQRKWCPITNPISSSKRIRCKFEALIWHSFSTNLDMIVFLLHLTFFLFWRWVWLQYVTPLRVGMCFPQLLPLHSVISVHFSSYSNSCATYFSNKFSIIWPGSLDGSKRLFVAVYEAKCFIRSKPKH